MIKLAVAIADTTALPSALVVLRGFEQSIRKAAALGYDGVELALKHAGEVDVTTLSRRLAAAGLEVSCISTGQVYAGLGLSFTDPDRARRAEVRTVFKGLIDLAAEFGRMVNIGRVRGQLGSDPPAARARFIEMARELCDYAASKNVTLLLEPVSRDEINFINNLPQGAELMSQVARANMKLMPDLFHMNIEDASLGGELAKHIGSIGYLHLADSNRLAPGQGRIDFAEVFAALKAAGYDGWASVEILPEPDPDTAARQAADFLRPLVEEYNRA